jgi:glycosyltransferase involved in cell wall biosynthesis
MKVALVYNGRRGDAERVLKVLQRLYPAASVYTPPQPGWSRGLVSSSLYRSLLPYLWSTVDLSAYDLVVSLTDGDLCPALLTAAHTLHISYCLTPPRDLWERFAAQLNGAQAWQQVRLRRQDYAAAQSVDRFVTSCDRVARRIGKFYRRSAEVLPPPVPVPDQRTLDRTLDRLLAQPVAGAAPKAGAAPYYLYVGALQWEQRVEWAIAACNALRLTLWIVGTGSELSRLKQRAGPTVQFLGAVPATDLPALYARATALIYPSETADFGFSPVEAMGWGIPAIACAHSGLREVILDYRTGLLFPESSEESLRRALQQFAGLRFSAQACIERAREFAEGVFLSKFEWFVAQALDEHQHKGPLASYLHGRTAAKDPETP